MYEIHINQRTLGAYTLLPIKELSIALDIVSKPRNRGMVCRLITYDDIDGSLVKIEEVTEELILYYQLKVR